MPLRFDLICLGTGPASLTVATTCAKQGWNVAIAEPREFGGTCALRGCNPKKVFTNAASLLDQFKRATGRLVRGADARVEWTDLVQFQHQFTTPVSELTEEKLRSRGIRMFHGVAQFESESIVRVGEALLSAENIFIGVGARPATLEIPGNELAITSDDFMELDSLPARILFLGGGFIAFEFAHLAARAGSTVTIADRNPLPLKAFDPDLVRLLIKCSEAQGMKILCKTEATYVERREDSLKVMLNTPEGTKTIHTDLVVNSGGRVPNLAGMDLSVGKVAHGKRGVTVNQFLQSTSNPAVYAAGDCADTGVPMLTPTANESARIAAANLMEGKKAKESHLEPAHQRVDYGPVPQVVFCVPPLAAVGLSEQEARSRGADVDVRFADLSTKGEVRKLCAAGAGCKFIIDRQTDLILGAHVWGPHAEDVINLFALAIRFGLTSSSVQATLFTYPTMTAEYCRVLG